MGKGIFVTATGTDVGKTYICGLLLKKLLQDGKNAVYYKAALSGAIEVEGELIAGDAKYVLEKAGLDLNPNDYVSYIYKNPYSPHLASQLEEKPLELSKVKNDYEYLQKKHDYIIVEGSGGIICPLRMDDEVQIMLTDVIKQLKLDIVIVASSGLGTLNSTILTIKYAQNENLNIKGIILNEYDEKNIIHRDNREKIELLSGIPVIALVEKNAEEINIKRLS